MYYLAKTNNFGMFSPVSSCIGLVYDCTCCHVDSIEEFGQIIVKYFLNTYTDVVNKVSVEIVRQKWERIVGESASGRSMEHKHAFSRSTTGIPFCKVQGMCNGNGPHNRSGRAGSAITVTMQGGFKGLDVLKTTQSGFVNFHKCKLTTLPSDTDRFVGTSVDAEWSYDSRMLNRRVDYAELYYAIEKTLLATFTGPADTGVYSPSVQKTLYEMANVSLKNHPAIDKMTLYMPNLHFLPFPLQEKFGIKNADCSGKPNIFFPIDEPHGWIKVCFLRKHLILWYNILYSCLFYFT